MYFSIIGSCVTRDAFEYDSRIKNNLLNYQARTSFATLNPRNIERVISSKNFEKLDNIQSDFKRRMVEFDFNNNTLNSNKKESKLIIDLIDERFHLAYVDNKVVTRSPEFLLSQIPVSSTINTFSEDFFNLWCEGFENFLNIFERSNNLNNLFINKTYWASYTSDGEELSDQRFPKELIEKHNLKLDRMYAYLKKIVHENNFFTFDDELMQIDLNHKWGISPFHYKAEYYKKLISFL